MKRYSVLFIVLASLLATVGLPVAAQQATATPAPVTSPGGWDESICNGSEGVVFRTVNATTSDLPAAEGCLMDDEMGWYVVEPWARETNQQNVDRGCFASSWTSVSLVLRNNGWTEGSAWRVMNEFADNPLVVNCDDVDSPADLGLNPFEDQVRVQEIRALLARALELLEDNDYTLASYIAEFGDTPMAELFTLIQLLSLGGTAG